MGSLPFLAAAILSIAFEGLARFCRVSTTTSRKGHIGSSASIAPGTGSYTRFRTWLGLFASSRMGSALTVVTSPFAYRRPRLKWPRHYCH